MPTAPHPRDFTDLPLASRRRDLFPQGFGATLDVGLKPLEDIEALVDHGLSDIVDSLEVIGRPSLGGVGENFVGGDQDESEEVHTAIIGGDAVPQPTYVLGITTTGSPSVQQVSLPVTQIVQTVTIVATPLEQSPAATLLASSSVAVLPTPVETKTQKLETLAVATASVAEAETTHAAIITGVNPPLSSSSTSTNFVPAPSGVETASESDHVLAFAATTTATATATPPASVTRTHTPISTSGSERVRTASLTGTPPASLISQTAAASLSNQRSVTSLSLTLPPPSSNIASALASVTGEHDNLESGESPELTFGHAALLAVHTGDGTPTGARGWHAGEDQSVAVDDDEGSDGPTGTGGASPEGKSGGEHNSDAASRDIAVVLVIILVVIVLVGGIFLCRRQGRRARRQSSSGWWAARRRTRQACSYYRDQPRTPPGPNSSRSGGFKASAIGIGAVCTGNAEKLWMAQAGAQPQAPLGTCREVSAIHLPGLPPTAELKRYSRGGKSVVFYGPGPASGSACTESESSFRSSTSSLRNLLAQFPDSPGPKDCLKGFASAQNQLLGDVGAGGAGGSSRDEMLAPFDFVETKKV